VPAGVEVRFREASLWERYRWELVIAGIGFVLQSLVVGLLLVERRRRWRAEAKARENLVVLARMNRASALGELIASLAHEINSPLGAILNNAEAAQRFFALGDVAESRACVDDIVHDANRAGEVIRRIASVLRREQLPEPLDLGAPVRHALDLLGAMARDRGVAVDVELEPALPPVTADPVQLVLVVVNLVVNALDAVAGLPPSRRRVRVSVCARGDHVAVRVEDAGPGVPAADRARVFDPFFTTKPRGVGMGLSVSRSIVEAHGGSITLSQSRDGGAAFEVLLPTEVAEPSPNAKGVG
jgi:signal transduction histidine kinase